MSDQGNYAKARASEPSYFPIRKSAPIQRNIERVLVIDVTPTHLSDAPPPLTPP